jgi:ubiquitin-protein ligase
MGWMPSYDLNSIIVSLLVIFEYPESRDALNKEAGILLDSNYEEFRRKVIEWEKEEDRCD